MSSPTFTQDERDCIIANLTGPRRHWLNAFHGYIRRGNHKRADECLDMIIYFDNMIAKVDGLSND